MMQNGFAEFSRVSSLIFSHSFRKCATFSVTVCVFIVLYNPVLENVLQICVLSVSYGQFYKLRYELCTSLQYSFVLPVSLTFIVTIIFCIVLFLTEQVFVSSSYFLIYYPCALVT
jgi:hypothetical protein